MLYFPKLSTYIPRLGDWLDFISTFPLRPPVLPHSCFCDWKSKIAIPALYFEMDSRNFDNKRTHRKCGNSRRDRKIDKNTTDKNWKSTIHNWRISFEPHLLTTRIRLTSTMNLFNWKGVLTEYQRIPAEFQLIPYAFQYISKRSQLNYIWFRRISNEILNEFSYGPICFLFKFFFS